MEKGVIEVAAGSAVLFAVPAVHFQADFALEVNRACCDPARRPNAIAVELGPLIAAAARRWLGELGIGPGRRTRLPCMLGLVKRNRFLRPSARVRASELQRETGLDLSRIPPLRLYEELGLASSSVLALSPTDSIVEAMRCACELDLPLYGVDLEDMADPVYPNFLFPDPTGEASVPPGDLCRIAAAAPGDPEVDTRRETAMAARLKGVLERHGRVLFTGGMGHWNRIERLISEKTLRPAVKGLEASPQGDAGIFRRVVIHPALASAHMDAFPAVAKAFESRRRHPGLGPPGRSRPIDRDAILRALLKKAYRRHFSGSSASPDRTTDAGKGADWSGLTVFEQLLRGLTLLNLRSQPTLSLLDSCARATFSNDLCDTLRRSFTEFPWVDGKTLPGCGLLRPSLAGEGGPGQMVLSDTDADPGEIQIPKLLPGGSSGAGSFPVPECWPHATGLKIRASLYRYTWRPWEDLINGLCAMAIAHSFRQRREPAQETFTGQLLEGIDVKATLRAHSRGEERIWIRDTRLRGGPVPPDLPEGFPVVWIFDEESCPDGDPRDWSTYFEPIDWVANFTGDPAAFRRMIRTPGDGLVDLVTYSHPVLGPKASLSQAGIRHEVLSGLVVFSPIFPTYRQTASWFRFTGASRNPVTWCWRVLSCESVVRNLAARAVPSIQALRWQDLLIGSALPFAGPTLTVVAPRDFAMSSDVVRAAGRRGTSIRVVPASCFSPDLLQRIVQYHVVPGLLDKEGRTEYIPEAERVLGEPKDRYRHLVPPSWCTFGLER
jgi:hypothetical protein